jgi:hypothetical protein
MTHWLDMVVALLRADTSDLRELARIAGADPKTFYRGIDISALDLDGQKLDDIELSTPSPSPTRAGTQFELELFSPNSELQIVHKLKGAVRQEERVALLLAEFLRNRSRAIQIINGYSDKAMLATSAMNLLIDIYDRELDGKRFSNLQIARKISGRFAKSEDKRNVLAYFLAKYLGVYPDIRAWLKEKSIHKLSRDSQQEFVQFLSGPPKQ